MTEKEYQHCVQNIASALRQEMCRKTNCGECPLWARMTEIYGSEVITKSPSCSVFTLTHPQEMFKLVGVDAVVKKQPELWTYCKDGLPEDGSICLMTEQNTKDPGWKRVEYGSLLDGEWQEIDEWETYPHYDPIAIGWEVVAWMPWPEPAEGLPK